MRAAPLLLPLLVCLASACQKQSDNVPFAPVMGGGVSVNANDTHDSTSLDDAGEHLGLDASVPAFSCERVPALHGMAADGSFATTTMAPADFLVTRQAELWNASCENPLLTLELSDGLCPDGSGHELDLALSVNDVADGVLHAGNNPILPEPDAHSVFVRYTRPASLTVSGTFGTCADASGELVFIEPPDLSAGSVLQISYQFLLTPCDGSGAAPIEVDGTIKYQLRYEQSQFCATTPASGP